MNYKLTTNKNKEIKYKLFRHIRTFEWGKEMKSEQFVTLIIRLFVVYLSLTVLFQAFTTAVMLVSGYQDINIAQVLSYGGLFVFVISVFVLAWKNAERIARFILPDTKETTLDIPTLSFEQIQVLLFMLLGAWVALDSFAVVARGMLVFSFSNLKGFVMQADFYAHVIRLFVGVWLLLNAKAFVNIINKLRS